jgi:hypothetical protein
VEISSYVARNKHHITLFFFEGEPLIPGSHWPGFRRRVIKQLRNAVDTDFHNIILWRQQLENDVRRINERSQKSTVLGDAGDIELLSTNSLGNGNHEILQSGVTMMNETERCLPFQSINVASLNQDQKRAYEIIIWHLDENLAGHSPPPLRMVIYGKGGAGKSQVLQTITAAFKAQSQEDLLVKAAYTATASLKSTDGYLDICVQIRKYKSDFNRNALIEIHRST